MNLNRIIPAKGKVTLSNSGFPILGGKMEVYEILERIREEKPVVHHLTNWVTIYDCANIVKVFGASSVMAHAKEEVADMINLASALVLNIGTLTSEFVDAAIEAARAANRKGIPVVLDVCGAGATRFRDRKVFEILNEVEIGILKGNSSEVARVAGENVRTKGVDAVEVEKNLVEIAEKVVRMGAQTVVITGKEDVVTDGKKRYFVRNGCEMMAHIVGTGCMATSVIGTFAAAEVDLAKAAAAGLCVYEVAAEIADEISSGPGSFKMNLYDAAFALSRKQVEGRKRVFEE